MKINKKLLICLVNCLFISTAFGQAEKVTQSPYELTPQQQRELRTTKSGIGKDENGMMIQPPAERKPVPALTEEQKAALKENQRNYELTLRRLQPPAFYYQKYESFLKNERNGLARIFADKNCDTGKTVSVQELERCGDVIPVKGGGSYYSFRTKSNSGYLREWWDLHFIDGKLKVGSDSVQTIIAEIGDVDLEKLKLNAAAFNFLNKYEAKKTIAEIKEQNELLAKGINSDGFAYSNFAAANLNSTYVLRSVAYRLDGETTFDSEDRINKLNRLYGSGRGIDITIAFRIVGREKDNSLILLWKELKMDLPRRKLK